MVENWFQTFARVIDGRSGAKELFVIDVRAGPPRFLEISAPQQRSNVITSTSTSIKVARFANGVLYNMMTSAFSSKCDGTARPVGFKARLRQSAVKLRGRAQAAESGAARAAVGGSGGSGSGGGRSAEQAAAAAAAVAGAAVGCFAVTSQ